MFHYSAKEKYLHSEKDVNWVNRSSAGRMCKVPISLEETFVIESLVLEKTSKIIEPNQHIRLNHKEHNQHKRKNTTNTKEENHYWGLLNTRQNWLLQ